MIINAFIQLCVCLNYVVESCIFKSDARAANVLECAATPARYCGLETHSPNNNRFLVNEAAVKEACCVNL